MLKFLTTFLIFSFLAVNVGVHTASASILSVIRALVTINPLEVRITPPQSAEVDAMFKIEAQLINKGDKKIDNVEARIFLPEGLVAIGNEVKKGGSIQSRKEKVVRWSVISARSGNFVVSVKASGDIDDQAISSEDSVLVTVNESQGSRARGENMFNIVLKLLERLFNLKGNEAGR